MGIDIVYILKQLWKEIGVILVMIAIFIAAITYSKRLANGRQLLCPVCHQTCPVLYEKKYTHEIVGCKGCIAEISQGAYREY